VEEAIRVFEEVGDAAGTARALGVRGMFRLWQGGTEAAIKDLERAAQYARQVDDRPHEADILRYVLVAILFGPTPVEDALERVEEIRSRTGTNRTLEVTLLRTRGQLEAMQGNFDSARNLIAQGKALGGGTRPRVDARRRHPHPSGLYRAARRRCLRCRA
jgi:hypothetical protein